MCLSYSFRIFSSSGYLAIAQILELKCCHCVYINTQIINLVYVNARYIHGILAVAFVLFCAINCFTYGCMFTTDCGVSRK